MPIYEYSCNECDTTQERYEPHMNEEKAPVCKDCSEPMSKLASTASFDLRGAGFYQNEYGNGAHKLPVTDQAFRAKRDIAERGLHPACPMGEVGPSKPSYRLTEAHKKKYGSKGWKEHMNGGMRDG